MNQFFAASAALVLALTLWGTGRRPKNLFITKFSKDLPVTQLSLVERSNKAVSKQSAFSSSELVFQLPITPKDRISLKKTLRKLISQGPEERLLAVLTAEKWGDSSIVPILRKGLKDSDSRVVLTAAAAISKFKCCPKVDKSKNLVRHPLNVSLMR